jgi:excisionase family DNA binding protein
MDSKPLAYSVKDAAEASGIGRTAIFAAIKDGRLPAKKFGRRTLIDAADLKLFLDCLPSVQANSDPSRRG